MSSTSLVLFVDLKPDTKLDLRTAARAAIAWADMVERVGHHFDPNSSTIIELESAQPGSQKIKAVVRSLVGDTKTAIRTAIISTLIFLAKDTVTWTWEQVLEYMKGPDAPVETQSLSEEEREALAVEVVEALEKRLADKEARRVFSQLANDENVTGAAISSSDTARPRVVVPRSEFPPEVFQIEDSGLERRVKKERADLVLLRAILKPDTNRRWGFSWPHGNIGAKIKDQSFLDRMAAGELNLQLAQGIVFTVELEIIEERKDAVWEVKEYVITKVLHIEIPTRQSGFDLE